MYYVILKSLFAAECGGAVEWNKVERKGTGQVDVIPVVVEEPAGIGRLRGSGIGGRRNNPA